MSLKILLTCVGMEFQASGPIAEPRCLACEGSDRQRAGTPGEPEGVARLEELIGEGKVEE